MDGKLTAGWHARTVKQNLQAAVGDPAMSEAGRLVGEALGRSELFRSAALPRRIRPPLLSRYEPGMTYGTHIDDAVMASELRADLSLTLFLESPESYEGGALVIESTGGEQSFKLPAGAAILYPANTLHRVEPVTLGARHVALTWIQSMVRDADKREILFDLDAVRRSSFRASGKTHEFDLLAKSYANLLRLWAEV